MISRGFGRHPWDGGGIDLLTIIVRTTFTVIAAAWSKTALAVTLLRLVDGWMRWMLWFIIFSLNLFVSVSVVMSWVGCVPVQKSWIIEAEGSCVDRSIIMPLGFMAGWYSAGCDFLLALLPWKIIWTLRIEKKEKLGIGIAMSMGVSYAVSYHPLIQA